MQEGLWTKGLVIGIIILFLGTSFLPSISGEIENNPVLNQNNKTEPTPMFYETGIGFITNKTDLGDDNISFNAVFFFFYNTVSGPETGLYRSHEYFKVSAGGLGYFGKSFVFFLH